MYDVLGTLRAKYPEDWLFALGSFHPSRLNKFKELNVSGDYKGWIFQYKKRNETFDKLFDALISDHLPRLDNAGNQRVARIIIKLQEKVAEWKRVRLEQKELTKQLFKDRSMLKHSLVHLYKELQSKESGLAEKLKIWTTHGLLDRRAEKLVIAALEAVGLHDTEEARNTLENIQRNHSLKKEIERLEIQLNTINVLLFEQILELKTERIHLLIDTVEYLCTIIDFNDSTESSYRIEQVHDKIAAELLATQKRRRTCSTPPTITMPIEVHS